MRMQNAMIGFAIAILLVLSITNGEATQMRQLTLAEMSQRSNCILTGRIVEIRYQEAQGQTWTVVKVAAEQVLKGHAAEYTFRVPGGQKNVGGRILVTRVDGVPSFSLLQRGVFFLGGRVAEMMQPVGWSQGFRRIEIQEGIEMVASGSEESGSQPAMKLSDFLNRVKSSQKEK